MNTLYKNLLAIQIFILLISGIAAYSNSFNVPFYFDDENNVMHPSLRLQEISFNSLLHAAFDGTEGDRPISNLSFSLNYYLSGFDVWNYHLVNLIIHLCAGFFLFLLFRATISLPINEKYNDRYSSLAFMSALIWLLHPVATQSVTYIVQRMNSMAAMFYVLSILLYVLGRKRSKTIQHQNKISKKWFFYAGSIFTGLCAIGSKEIAATLPIIIFLYEWYFFQNLSQQWLKKQIGWLIFAVIIISILIFIYLNGNPLKYILNSCNAREFTTIERIMTQFRVVMYYIGLLLYPNPSRMVFDYNFPFSTSLLNPITTIFSLGGIILITGTGFILSRKERLLSFCLFCFLGNLVIESSVVCLELIFEHRTYLPSMFMLLFFTAISYRFFSNKVIPFALLLIVAVLFAFWTYERNVTWQDPIAFWEDNISKSPGKARTYSNLGKEYSHKKEWQLALINFRHALEINPNHPAALNNLGTVLVELNRFEEAENTFLQVIDQRPDFIKPLMNYASLLRRMGKNEEAISTYQKAIELDPKYSLLNKSLGQLLLFSGKPQEAILHLETALERLPESTEVRSGLADAYLSTGNSDAAIEMYRSVLKIDPDHKGTHGKLAYLLSGKAPDEEVIQHYLKVLRTEPLNITVLYNLANHYLRTNQPEKAKPYYLRIISLTPELSNAYNNLGMIYMADGHSREAEELIKAALRIMPENIQAQNNLEALQQRNKTP